MRSFTWAGQLGSWIIARQSITVSGKGLPAYTYTSANTSSRDLTSLQQHLEASLLQSLRAESEAYLIWWDEHVTFARLFRLWLIVGIGSLITALVFSAPDALTAGIFGNVVVTGLFVATVPFLAAQHRLMLLARETYIEAITHIGGYGMLPSWVPLIAGSPVMVGSSFCGYPNAPERAIDASLFGSISGYDQWIEQQDVDAATLEVLERLAPEFGGTLADLLGTAKALAR